MRFCQLQLFPLLRHRRRLVGSVITAVRPPIMANARKNSERKFKAKLSGGPNKGQVWELSYPWDEMKIANGMQERDGKMRIVGTVTYKLKSNGPRWNINSRKIQIKTISKKEGYIRLEKGTEMMATVQREPGPTLSWGLTSGH